MVMIPQIQHPERLSTVVKIGWNTDANDQIPSFTGTYDNISAGVVNAVNMSRGTDTESQANGTILSGSLRMQLTGVDTALGTVTNALNVRNPESPLFGTKANGQWIQVSYQTTEPGMVTDILVAAYGTGSNHEDKIYFYNGETNAWVNQAWYPYNTSRQAPGLAVSRSRTSYGIPVKSAWVQGSNGTAWRLHEQSGLTGAVTSRVITHSDGSNFGSIDGIAYDNDGNLLIVERHTNRLYTYNTSTHATNSDSLALLAYPYNAPTGVSVAADGRVFVLAGGRDGALDKFYIYDGISWDKGTDLSSTIQNASDISVNDDGTVYVVDINDAIYRFTPNRILGGGEWESINMNAAENNIRYTGIATYTRPAGASVTKTIPVWTGRLIDYSPQAGTTPSINVKARGVLGFVNRQKISISKQLNVNSLAACVQILNAAGITNIQYLDGYTQGLTTLSEFEVVKKRPLEALQDVLAAEDGHIVESADGGVILVPRNFRNYNRIMSASFQDDFTPTHNDIAYTTQSHDNIVGNTIPVFPIGVSGTEIHESSQTIFNTFNAIVEQSVVNPDTRITDEHEFSKRDGFFPTPISTQLRAENQEADFGSLRTYAEELAKDGTLEFLPARGQIEVDITVTPAGDYDERAIITEWVQLGRAEDIEWGYNDYADGTRAAKPDRADQFTLEYENDMYIVDEVEITPSDGNVVEGQEFTDIDIGFRYETGDDEVTMFITNLTNYDYYVVGVGALRTTSREILPPTRTPMPNDGSNGTSVEKYGVQEYPREPIFGGDNGINNALDWSRELLALYGEPREVATIECETAYLSTLERLLKLELNQIVSLVTGGVSGLYANGVYFIQHLQIDLRVTGRGNRYKVYITAEPIAINDASTYMGDTTAGDTDYNLAWGETT